MTENARAAPDSPGSAPIPAPTARVPAQGASTPDARTRPLTYACAGCGARVEFAPGTARWCPDLPARGGGDPGRRHDPGAPVRRAGAAAARGAGGHVWSSPACRATTDSDLLASKCQFCGAPLVDAGETSEQIAPEAVLPFEVDRAGVRSALREWVASRRFAPRNFRSVSEAESLSGTYVPHWTFDADTRSDYVGQRGDHYWETETYTTTVDGQTQTQTRQVMRTRWTHASGRVARAFDDVMVRGPLAGSRRSGQTGAVAARVRGGLPAGIPVGLQRPAV